MVTKGEKLVTEIISFAAAILVVGVDVNLVEHCLEAGALPALDNVLPCNRLQRQPTTPHTRGVNR